MAYSADIKSLIGAVRSSLAAQGITRQSEQYSQHGQHQPQPDSPLVMVACSGGRDSLALAWVAHTVCAMLGVRCGAVIIDHGLFETSAQLTRKVVDSCEDIGLKPVISQRIHVVPKGQGTESAAREARYAAICDVAQTLGAELVLLAHTADDQAETVLMGLLRGGGLGALAGMPQSMVRAGVHFLRPLLDNSRRQTTQTCTDLDLDWWDDPTNGENMDGKLGVEYPLRSRVRHDLIPQIEEFWGSSVAPQLAAGAKSAQIDLQYLDSLAGAAFEKLVKFSSASDSLAGRLVSDTAPIMQLSVNATAIAKEHAAMRYRIWSQCLQTLDLPPARKHLEALDKLAVDWHGQGPIVISRGYSALRKGHVILICKDGWHANR